MRKRVLLPVSLLLLSAFVLQAGVTSSANFELRKGFILIRGNLNGEEGLYIFDSGAPGLVLNSRYHLSDNYGQVALNGIGGSISAPTCSSHVFSWNDFAFEAENAPCIDLSYLEEATGEALHGLVGLELFGSRAIIIDYASRKIRIAHSGPEATMTGAYIALPIRFHQHIATVSLRYGRHSLIFGIDTGSRSNLLTPQAAGKFEKEDLRILKLVDLVGADQRVIRSDEVLVTGLRSVESRLEPMEFVVTELSHLGAQQIDGILGHEFFADRQVYLDGRRQFIYISLQSGTTANLIDIPSR